MRDFAQSGTAVWALLIVSLIVTLASARSRYRAVCEKYRSEALPH
jgi:hypothetical protein